MSSTSRDAVEPPLIGRDDEMVVISAFLDIAATDGGALLVSGEAGVGKTAVLAAAASRARGAGTRVLRAAGVQFEADVGFSTLHQLVLPLVDELGALDPMHRRALSVALGFTEGAVGGRLVVANAALELLRRAAAARPLLAIVDDLAWVDRSSAFVLGFVARRLSGSRAAFLAASRPDTASFFEHGDLPELELRSLDVPDAHRLLEREFPTLAPRVRHRVVSEAAGNPLALLELPDVLNDPRWSAARTMRPVRPLTGRLQSIFAERIAALPAATRRALLTVALEGSGDLRVLRATPGGRHTVASLAVAERASLVSLGPDGRDVTFRHPLIRAAVVGVSTEKQRRTTHRELAQALVADPERATWHLADAAVDPDELVAGRVEDNAGRALRRGDAVGAVTALTRAAQLGPTGAARARRLAGAAYVGAAITGDLRSVSGMLLEARRSDPSANESLQTVVAATAMLINGDGDVDTARRLLVTAVQGELEQAGSDDHVAVEAVHTLMLICFFGARPEPWAAFHHALAALGSRIPESLALASETFADPAHSGGPALERLGDAIRRLDGEDDPLQILRIAMAAFYVDRLAGCRDALWRLVTDGREGGAVTAAINALLMLCFDEIGSGRWNAAHERADEGLALCDGHGYTLLSWPGRYGKALLAAVQGDHDAARSSTDEMLRWATPRGVGVVVTYAHHVRALAALGRGDFESAYHHAAAISPPGTLISHCAHALWLTLDLVESAVRTGRHTEASAHVEVMRTLRIADLSPRLALMVATSEALVAPERDAVVRFDAALTTPSAEEWPFELARTHLLYGEHLRRTGAIRESRSHLDAALERFQRLGARPWTQRAGNELRATGRHRSRPRQPRAQLLTPQELQIAALAATGLTNKQIGERLFLSPRTVSGHLYHIFPKLGVTSRAGLRDALDRGSRLDPALARSG